mgnify:CR=1 FL=1
MVFRHGRVLVDAAIHGGHLDACAGIADATDRAAYWKKLAELLAAGTNRLVLDLFAEVLGRRQIISAEQVNERNSLVGYHHVNRNWASGTADSTSRAICSCPSTSARASG